MKIDILSALLGFAWSLIGNLASLIKKQMLLRNGQDLKYSPFDAIMCSILGVFMIFIAFSGNIFLRDYKDGDDGIDS